jgi:hypothetical protein
MDSVFLPVDFVFCMHSQHEKRVLRLYSFPVGALERESNRFHAIRALQQINTHREELPCIAHFIIALVPLFVIKPETQ